MGAYRGVFNKLTGSLPASMSKWQKLETFRVAGNRLSGPIPALNFSNFRDLQGLRAFALSELKTLTTLWPKL